MVVESANQTAEVFHLAPKRMEMVELVIDIAKYYYKLESVAILYDDKVKDLEIVVRVAEEGWLLVTRKLHTVSNMDEGNKNQPRLMNKAVLTEIRQMGIQHIILHTHTTTISNVMEVAMHLGMLSYRYHWILSNLDTAYLDLSRYLYAGMNLTLFRPSRDESVVTVGSDKEHGIDTYEAILFRDALAVITSAVDEFIRNDGQFNWTNSSASCFSADLRPSTPSNIIRNYISKVTCQ
ncbi:glutamate receptor ionotropic, kainate 2-like [Glandiceps talaboti]